MVTKDEVLSSRLTYERLARTYLYQRGWQLDLLRGWTKGDSPSYLFDVAVALALGTEPRNFLPLASSVLLSGAVHDAVSGSKPSDQEPTDDHES